MTRTSALMELNRLMDRGRAAGVPLEMDEPEMLVYLHVEAEHRDYVFWRAVQTGYGGLSIEQCVDADTGDCSVTRVWLTPLERAAARADGRIK